MELGQSVEKAAKEKEVSETVLIPERIQKAEIVRPVAEKRVVPFTPRPEPIPEPEPVAAAAHVVEYVEEEEIVSAVDRSELEAALERLTSLRRRWEEFKNPA